MLRFTLASKIVLILTIAFGFTCDFATAREIKHVIVISVDGLGAKLLSESDAPNLKKMASETPQALKTETIIPSITVAGHTSMLTGVDPSRHKMIHNELDESLQKISVPTIFDLLKKNGIESAAIFGKPKLEFIFDNGAITRLKLPKAFLIGSFWGRFPGTVTRVAKKEIKKKQPPFLFIHHSMVDVMGHWFKWGSWAQKNALKAVDESIGEIADAAKKHYPPDSYVIIVTADHGGHEGSHGQMNNDGTLESPETDLLIPWIVYGAKIKDPNRTIKVYDTAAAVAQLLGLAVPKDWNWQGVSPLEEIAK